ncbi:MAG: hypothetical protein BRC28_03845, partial [Nanohaloarchaea archaeon SW_4_43_9]
MDKYFFAGVGGLLLVTVSISLVATSSGNSFTGQEKAAVISLDGAITSTSDSFTPQTGLWGDTFNFTVDMLYGYFDPR